MFGNRVPLRFAIQVQLRQNYKSSNPSMARYPTSTVSFSPPSAEEWSELNGSTESTNFVKHMKNSRGNQALTGGRSKTHLSSDGMVQAIHSEFTFSPARFVVEDHNFGGVHEMAPSFEVFLREGLHPNGL